ncbi:MAG: hypothetical protein AB7U81_10505 [Thiohalomonadaceae bacterium]
MKKTVQLVAYAVLLPGTLAFGLLGRPAEMGLAIVAAAIALAFADIERFSRIRGAGFEAEMREQFQAVLEKETEIPPKGEPRLAGVDAAALAVMGALANPGYTWRYFGGVRKDSGLDNKQTARTLGWLVAQGYARRSQARHGSIWSLTAEGRRVLAAAGTNGTRQRLHAVD